MNNLIPADFVEQHQAFTHRFMREASIHHDSHWLNSWIYREAARWPANHAELPRQLLAQARFYWRHLPHPLNHWQPHPVTDPGRNEPCYCGSLRKYKQCCEPLADELRHSALAYEMEIMLLDQLFEALPKTRLKQLLINIPPPAALAGEIAEILFEQDVAFNLIIAMLEASLADLEHLDARAELAYEILLNLFPDGFSNKKKCLWLERGLNCRDTTLRCAAMHRQISALADQGDYPKAWALFQQTLRLQPDNPSHAHLELILLWNQGRQSEAIGRADFWLRKLGGKVSSELLDWLKAFRDNPDATMGITGMHHAPELLDLNQIFSALPAPNADAQQWQNAGDRQFILRHSKAGIGRYLEWQKSVEQESGLIDDASLLLELAVDELRQQPRLTDDLLVLGELCESLNSYPPGPNLLSQTVLARFHGLLEQLLKTLPTKAEASWAMRDNRPWLQSIGNAMILARHCQQLTVAQQLAQSLLRLNPNDNQGIRFNYSCWLMHSGDFNAQLQLAAQYPDDISVQLATDAALAYFRLGQRSQADHALQSVLIEHPQLGDYLQGKKQRPPRGYQQGLIRYNSQDSYWIYWQQCGLLWQTVEVREWLDWCLQKQQTVKNLQRMARKLSASLTAEQRQTKTKAKTKRKPTASRKTAAQKPVTKKTNSTTTAKPTNDQQQDLF